MSEATTSVPTGESVERMLLEELARGDAVMATARPMLRHRLANDDPGLFSEAVIARARGTMLDLAEQLLAAEAAAGEIDLSGLLASRQESLAQALTEDESLLSHVHALVLEAQLAERLQAGFGIDAALSPLVQEQAAKSDPAVVERARALLAAQSRFMRHARRAELPLHELPADLFDRAMASLRAQDGTHINGAERRLRSHYREDASRLGLIGNLLWETPPEEMGQVSLQHLGLAIFASGLAAASSRSREELILSFAATQSVRLALSLRAAGLGDRALLDQFLLLHPDGIPPQGLEAISADRARALLSAMPEATA